MEEQILAELLLGISLPLAMIMMLLLMNTVRFEIKTKSIIHCSSSLLVKYNHGKQEKRIDSASGIFNRKLV